MNQAETQTAYDPKPAANAARLPLSQKQTSAMQAAKSLAVKTRWRELIGEAETVWHRISSAELATVEGNIHVLAGLVQLRQGLTRAESDEQVRAFFATHYSASDSPYSAR